jgi:hypothetical protein
VILAQITVIHHKNDCNILLQEICFAENLVKIAENNANYIPMKSILRNTFGQSLQTKILNGQIQVF